jgi:hypothetical protein
MSKLLCPYVSCGFYGPRTTYGWKRQKAQLLFPLQAVRLPEIEMKIPMMTHSLFLCQLNRCYINYSSALGEGKSDHYTRWLPQ